MTPEQKKQIVQMAEEQRANKQLSANQAAELIDISPAMYSFAINNKWENIGPLTWRKLALWVGYSSKDWLIRETANQQIIRNMCADAQANRRTLGIMGYTGAGKSSGLTAYAKANTQAYYVLCKVIKGRKEFLTDILKAMGADAYGTTSTRLELVIEAMKKKPMALLMFDSTHKLADPNYEILQQLTESLEHECGIIIAGTHLIRKIIDNGAQRDRKGFQELRRRIEYWATLMPISRDFITTVARDFGITDNDALKYLHRTINDFGTLRSLITNYSNMPKEDKSQVDILTSLPISTNNNVAA